MVFHCTNMPQFLIHSTTGDYLECPQVWAIINSTALNSCTSLLVTKEHMSADYKPRSGYYRSSDMQRLRYNI